MDRWYLENLVCPVDKQPLKCDGENLISSLGRKYPIIDGVPVMLVDDVNQTMPLVKASLGRAQKNSEVIDKRAPSLYLESLGISEEEKKGVIKLALQGNSYIDPVVSYIIGATSGYSYRKLQGKITEYPIPELRLPKGNGKLLLDIGCNWGRWSIAASKKGYAVVGLDPSLGAVMTAKRVAKQLDLPIKYIVGDARFLPFRKNLFDIAFSYSVLQHLDKTYVQESLSEINRVLTSNGLSFIQMPNYLGIRCLQHQMKRGFREAKGFEVRYWSLAELENTFNEIIGKSVLSVDCYFGLGLQKSDMKYMSNRMKFIISISEILRKISILFPPLKYVADSIYIKSQKGR